MSVVWPTSTPLTSVMALLGPGVPSKGTPRSRARGLGWAVARAQKSDEKNEEIGRVENGRVRKRIIEFGPGSVEVSAEV